MKNNGTQPPVNAWNNLNSLARNRLESIKNSYSELNLLSLTNPSEFIFDFDKEGTDGRTVSATVIIRTIKFVFILVL